MAKDFDPERPASPLPGSLSDTFNIHRGAEVSEIELKFLARDDDPDLFRRLTSYFEQRGWIGHRRENVHLITRQLDTPTLELYANGTTVRMRAECEEDDIERLLTTPDICVKTGKTVDPSGAVRRGEYEVETGSFEQPLFQTLHEKYPEGDYPELYLALKGVEASGLLEYFRIDCARNSYLIELPPEETGLDGKRFVAELEIDDVLFVLDIPGLPEPFAFHYDREIECETKFQPPNHDDSCDQDLYSSPLTAEETDRGMAAMRDHILAAAGGGKLVPNYESKAERGFNALLRLLEMYIGVGAGNDNVPKHLADVPANGAPAHAVDDNHRIAVRRPQP